MHYIQALNKLARSTYFSVHLFCLPDCGLFRFIHYNFDMETERTCGGGGDDVVQLVAMTNVVFLY